jgi:hypothetical protein
MNPTEKIQGVRAKRKWNQIPLPAWSTQGTKTESPLQQNKRTKIDRETDRSKKNEAAAADNEWRKPTQEKETLHEPNQPQSKSYFTQIWWNNREKHTGKIEVHNGI